MAGWGSRPARCRAAVTQTVATRRLRTDRMHHHIPGWTEQVHAELEALLRAAYDGPKHIYLPDRATAWLVDPKANPRRRTRGPQRMREHTRSLLLNALRSDGTLESTIQVQTCKAYRVLPWDIGLRPQDSSVETPKLVTRADVEASYVEHVAEPIMNYLTDALPDGLEFKLTDEPGGYVAQGLMTYEQVRADLGLDEPFATAPNFVAETDFERLWHISLSPAAHLVLGERPAYTAAARVFTERPHPSIVEAFLDHDLTAPAARGARPTKRHRPLTENRYFVGRMLVIASPLIISGLITGLYYLFR